MAYIKYKEITKYFNFRRVIDKSILPDYVTDYVFDDEVILTAYKTSTDHGIFTDKKIVLFDNYSFFRLKKIIYIVPYKSISTLSIMFCRNYAELTLYMDSGYPVRLKFVNMDAIDKRRLRYIFSFISKTVNSQKPNKEERDRLVNDDISFERKE